MKIKSVMHPIVNQLFLYPVIYLQAMSMQRALVTSEGFKNDFTFRICKPDGVNLNKAHHSILNQMIPTLTAAKIEIALTQQKRMSALLSDFSVTMMPNIDMSALMPTKIAPIAMNQFLSNIFDEDVQLRWRHPNAIHTKQYQELKVKNSKIYRLINLNTHYHLKKNKLLNPKHSFLSERGHILITDVMPFAENNWKTIKIGSVFFDVITNIENQHNFTADFNLTKFLVAKNEGEIAINDFVEIIELTNQLQNLAPTKNKIQDDCVITFGKHTFTGNKNQPLLEQLEQQNINIPNSCRTGICKKCFITLIEGEVTELTQFKKSEKQILACSCTPKSDYLVLKDNISKKT